MKKVYTAKLTVIYVGIVMFFLLCAFGASHAVTAMSENSVLKNRSCVIIDAGHGGEDGGATSCTGVLESQINLEISLRLNDLMHLLGVKTQMIRTTDRSVYTQGQTIAAKKVSDLKQRVSIANSTENAVLLSIHQNHFSDSRYSGAQVFYAPTQDSKELADALQKDLITSVNPDSNRKIKKAESVYLMQHIHCTGVLVECGFLSNAKEESLLRNDAYQKKLSCVIATTLVNFLDRRSID